MKRYKVIVNPISGRGQGAQQVPEIEGQFETYGLSYDIVTTEKPLHAIALAKEAAVAGYDVVVAVGGDGTANEVLNGLMQARREGAKKTAMGILCVGRGNDFGFGMDVPPGVEEGCRVLSEDFRKTVDVGFVKGGFFPEGRYFGNGIGIGFDAVVGFEAAKLVHLHGFICYLVAALKTIFLYFKAPQVRVEYDGQALELSALMVSVMNGRRMGGGFMMAPDGKNDDGMLDLCIAREVSRLGIFKLIPRFMKGTQNSHPAIVSVRAKKVRVNALKGSLPAHSDGETLCYEGSELSIELQPAEIEMICMKK